MFLDPRVFLFLGFPSKVWILLIIICHVYLNRELLKLFSELRAQLQSCQHPLDMDKIISMFLFLRLICPAILSPSLFGLVSGIYCFLVFLCCSFYYLYVLSIQFFLTRCAPFCFSRISLPSSWPKSYIDCKSDPKPCELYKFGCEREIYGISEHFVFGKGVPSNERHSL